jgi:hypothetical protein
MPMNPHLKAAANGTETEGETVGQVDELPTQKAAVPGGQFRHREWLATLLT